MMSINAARTIILSRQAQGEYFGDESWEGETNRQNLTMAGLAKLFSGSPRSRLLWSQDQWHIQWCQDNERLFNSNKKRFNENKGSCLMGWSPADFKEPTHFINMEDASVYSVDTAAKEFANNQKSVELTAYYHYFICKQNRKRAKEFYDKLVELEYERLEIGEDISTESSDEGKYLQLSSEARAFYEKHKLVWEGMDRVGWWDIRHNNLKLYKLYSSL